MRHKHIWKTTNAQTLWWLGCLLIISIDTSYAIGMTLHNSLLPSECKSSFHMVMNSVPQEGCISKNIRNMLPQKEYGSNEDFISTTVIAARRGKMVHLVSVQLWIRYSHSHWWVFLTRIFPKRDDYDNIGNKGLHRGEQNKFSKKVTSSGDWTWDQLAQSRTHESAIQDVPQEES